MSYESIEAALRTVLAGVTGFSTTNVFLGDYSLLNRGYDQAIVLAYSGFAQQDIGGDGRKEITWEILGHLYVKYVNDAQVHSTARTTRTNVIDRVNQYYRLNGAANVSQADVVVGMTPGAGMPPAGLENIVIGAVHYYHEMFRFVILEESNFSYVG